MYDREERCWETTTLPVSVKRDTFVWNHWVESDGVTPLHVWHLKEPKLNICQKLYHTFLRNRRSKVKLKALWKIDKTTTPTTSITRWKAFFTGTPQLVKVFGPQFTYRADNLISNKLAKSHAKTAPYWWQHLRTQRPDALQPSTYEQFSTSVINEEDINGDHTWPLMVAIRRAKAKPQLWRLPHLRLEGGDADTGTEEAEEATLSEELVLFLFPVSHWMGLSTAERLSKRSEPSRQSLPFATIELLRESCCSSVLGDASWLPLLSTLVRGRSEEGELSFLLATDSSKEDPSSSSWGPCMPLSSKGFEVGLNWKKDTIVSQRRKP